MLVWCRWFQKHMQRCFYTTAYCSQLKILDGRAPTPSALKQHWEKNSIQQHIEEHVFRVLGCFHWMYRYKDVFNRRSLRYMTNGFHSPWTSQLCADPPVRLVVPNAIVAYFCIPLLGITASRNQLNINIRLMRGCVYIGFYSTIHRQIQSDTAAEQQQNSNPPVNNVRWAQGRPAKKIPVVLECFQVERTGGIYHLKAVNSSDIEWACRSRGWMEHCNTCILWFIMNHSCLGCDRRNAQSIPREENISAHAS